MPPRNGKDIAEDLKRTIVSGVQSGMSYQQRSKMTSNNESKKHQILEMSARKCALDVKPVKEWTLWPHSETLNLSYAVGVVCRWWTRPDSVPGEVSK